jgi:choline dehydrogenase
MDWNYPMVPQKYAYFAEEDNQINMPRGRVFGGSSVLNSMNYYRENPEYYDLWESVYGVKNWSFADNLPYFLKSENNLDSRLVNESEGLHGSGGLLSVSTVIPDKILERYITAAKLMGYPVTHSDGRDPFGVTIMQTSIKGGVRQSSATAFLESNIKKNLHTIGYSTVIKILFDEQKRAIGVEFRRKGFFYTVKATKEVIISAGVIGSPQLLMLSGIGPKKHLEYFNISVISDLRVGDNLQRSIYFELYFDIKNQSEIEKPVSNIDNKFRFYIERSGPLAYKSSGVQCFQETAYEMHPNVSNGCILPRLDFLPKNLEKLVKNHKLKDEWEDFYTPYLDSGYFSLLVVNRRPKSTGYLRLASDNPFDYPIIDPCIFCDKSDIEVLVKTTKLALAIYQSPYFRQYAEIYNQSIPGCNPCSDNYFCDSYIRCLAQTVTKYISPVGTCRMGSLNDTKAVVDEKLRVKGVSALRVIDSSVFPLVSEQTNTITLMIAERGAQFIKEDLYYENRSKDT